MAAIVGGRQVCGSLFLLRICDFLGHIIFLFPLLRNIPPTHLPLPIGR